MLKKIAKKGPNSIEFSEMPKREHGPLFSRPSPCCKTCTRPEHHTITAGTANLPARRNWSNHLLLTRQEKLHKKSFTHKNYSEPNLRWTLKLIHPAILLPNIQIRTGPQSRFRLKERARAETQVQHWAPCFAPDCLQTSNVQIHIYMSAISVSAGFSSFVASEVKVKLPGHNLYASKPN